MSFAFDDPSPAAFQGALAIFTLTTLYLYDSHREDRYQNYCLGAAVVATAMGSITRHLMFLDEPLARSVQICLPTSFMVGSAVSAIIHRLAAVATLRGQEPESEPKEKTLTEGQRKGEKQAS